MDGLRRAAGRHGACAIALVLVLLIVTPAADGAGAATAHQTVPTQVKIGANVSGSTLGVVVVALPHSRCSLRLGAGAGAVALHPIQIGPGERGRSRTDLSTDAPTGDQRVVATCAHAGTVSIGKTEVSISAIALHGPVATAFNIALDVLLGGAILTFGLLLFELSIGSTDPRERSMRLLAMAGGAILALGAEVTGIDFAGSIVEKLAGDDPTGTGGKVLIGVITGLIAVAFGWYFTQVIFHRATQGVRVACALAAFTLVGLALIFAEAFAVQGLFLAATAIPIFAFMVGLIAGVILSVPATDASAGGSGVLTNLISKLAKGRNASGSARPSERRSPFAGD